MTQRYMHLSPAALDSAIRLLDQPSAVQSFGDILETGRVSGENLTGAVHLRAARYGGQPSRESMSSLACQPKLAQTMRAEASEGWR